MDDAGESLLAVGDIDIGSDNAAIFLGRPVAEADPITLMFRRELFWTAVLADPPRVVEQVSLDIQVPGEDEAAGNLADHLRHVVGSGARSGGPAHRGPRSGARARSGRLGIAHPGGCPDSSGVPIPGIVCRFGCWTRPVKPIWPRSLPKWPLLAPRWSRSATPASSRTEPRTSSWPGGLDDPAITELAERTGATTVLDEVQGADADPVVTLLVGTDFLAEN